MASLREAIAKSKDPLQLNVPRLGFGCAKQILSPSQSGLNRDPSTAWEVRYANSHSAQDDSCAQDEGSAQCDSSLQGVADFVKLIGRAEIIPFPS
jgi:hypothetical protein